MAKQIPNKPDFIDHYIIGRGSICALCQYRKEIYTAPHNECLDCGWLKDRDRPYFSLQPVFRTDEDITPANRAIAYAHIKQLLTLPRKNLPSYCVGMANKSV